MLSIGTIAAKIFGTSNERRLKSFQTPMIHCGSCCQSGSADLAPRLRRFHARQFFNTHHGEIQISIRQMT